MKTTNERLCRIKIIRFTDNPTYGVLLVDGVPEVVTLELPWADNKPNISCIPEGTYKARRRKASPMITAGTEETFEILDVPGRSDILIHVGNTVDDIQGCVLVGQSYGKIGVQYAVLASRVAFTKLMSRLKRSSRGLPRKGGNEVEVEVVRVY